MPGMKKSPSKKYILSAGIALAVLVLIFGALSQSGFVFSGINLVRGAELVIENARPGSTIFIENKRSGTIGEDGTATFSGIKPGATNLIVSHTDAWPWVFDFESTAGASTTVAPLQVNVETDGSVLTDPEDPLLVRAKEKLNEYREPSRIQPLHRSEVQVWIEGANILTQQGEEVRTVFSSQNPIRNVLWYGDRNDVVIVTTLNNVFALDIRESEVQNFHPIYTGAAPEAVADPIRSDKIFVRDADQYFSISI